ncbi:unnamed protein product, partial [Porites lobata]
FLTHLIRSTTLLSYVSYMRLDCPTQLFSSSYSNLTLMTPSLIHFPHFLKKRVQRVQNAAAGFVLNHFCSERDVLELGWLPTLENTQLNILKLGHRALFSEVWPEYLQL